MGFPKKFLCQDLSRVSYLKENNLFKFPIARNFGENSITYFITCLFENFGLDFQVKSKFEGYIVFQCRQMVIAVPIGEAQSETVQNFIQFKPCFII